MSEVLPRHSSHLERALEQTVIWLETRALPIAHWDVDNCPEALLPQLAWALSVDIWDGDLPEDRRRALIRESIPLHREKGTRASIRRALDAAGYGDATIIESFGNKYDGEFSYDGEIAYVEADHWAEYRVVLARAVSAGQAEKIRAILQAVAPARCHLKALDFTEAPHLYDGEITYDGTHTYGAA